MLRYMVLVFLLRDYCLGSYLGGLFDPNCVILSNTSTTCPNENVTFWLYTNDTRDSPVKLDPLNLQKEAFQIRKPLYILLHGYRGHRNYIDFSIRPALLDAEDAYVISADYGPLVAYPCYIAAVANLPVASKCVAHLINRMIDQGVAENDDIHMIGFSLGAHVAGQTANHLEHRLKRITGLDPASPLFMTVDDDIRLDASDAEFVDVIHTDVWGFGKLNAMGHVDFYPNLGRFQPGCRDDTRRGVRKCNHYRAFQYYAESIRSGSKGFWAYSCPSWLHYVLGRSCNYSITNIMGHHVNQSVHGAFFLKTASSPPYALGPFN